MKIFWKKNSQNFHYLDKKPLTWGCLYNLWEVLIARIWKNICGKVIFWVPEIPPLKGVFGAWITFKKSEMAKTLRNGLSIIEMNPLNHNWSDFAILLGLSLHQFQRKLLLSDKIRFEVGLLHLNIPENIEEPVSVQLFLRLKIRKVLFCFTKSFERITL